MITTVVTSAVSATVAPLSSLPAACLAALEFRLSLLDVAVICVPLMLAFVVSLYMRKYTRNMFRLFGDLRAAKLDVNDDGQVHEDTPSTPEPPPAE